MNTANLELVCLVKVQMGLSNGAHLQNTAVDLIAKHELRVSNVIELFLTKVRLKDTTLLLQDLLLFIFQYLSWFCGV